MTSRPMLCDDGACAVVAIGRSARRSCGRSMLSSGLVARARHQVHLARGSRRAAGLEARVLDHLGRRHRARRPLGERPAAVLLDADRHRLVALAIEVREDRRRRGQRDLVLARPSAVDDADAKTLHGGTIVSPRCRIVNSRVAFMRDGCRLRVPRHASRRAGPRAACSRRRTGRSRRRCSCRSARAPPSRA